MIKLTPPKITAYLAGDSRRLCNLSSYNDVFGDLTLTTSKYEDGYDRFMTLINNKCGKSLGYEIFSLDRSKKYMFGYYMRVEPEYQKKFGFGELLRLSSIIEMLENNIPKIKIYSKDTAIYFHSRYKFQPEIVPFSERDEALKSIINNPAEGFENIVNTAKELYLKIKNATSGEEERKFCKDANIIVKDYIQQVLKTKDSYKSHPFKSGMSMELTKDSVIENRALFNTLFKKHGIDYNI